MPSQKEASDSAMQSGRLRGPRQRSLIWMQISNTNSEIYIAITSAVVLGLGIAFGSSFGLGLGA